MTTLQFIENLRLYIDSQLSIMSKNTPIIGVAKPIITRIVNNNIGKLSNILGLMANESGDIDIENILNEMLSNIMSANPFSVNIPVIGDVELGGGFIKLNIPFTDKRIVLDKTDFDTFKEMIINKQ